MRLIIVKKEFLLRLQNKRIDSIFLFVIGNYYFIQNQ